MITQHEKLIQKEVNDLIKQGYTPAKISISAKQNKGLENWAKNKGIVFSKTQKVDIVCPI